MLSFSRQLACSSATTGGYSDCCVQGRCLQDHFGGFKSAGFPAFSCAVYFLFSCHRLLRLKPFVFHRGKLVRRYQGGSPDVS